jgi:hypothetical protein
MHLMDMVTQTAAKIAHIGPEPTLRGYTDLAARLEGCPRYILDANACRTAVELNLGRPKILREAMTHLHIPFRRMWVEWEDADRQKLRERFPEPLTYPELRPMPGRVGFLLESDESGRRGTAIWAWDTPRGSPDIPNIGLIQPYFDLDRIFPLTPERTEGLLKGNLAALWMDNPTQLESLFDIWRTAQHRPVAWARDFWNCLPDPVLAEALSYSDVVGEYIMIWSVLLLLTASRPIVDLSHVSLTKLNKQRRKKAKVPLLDHTRVSLHLTPQAERPIVRGPLGYSRKSPRIHIVSSYLARRGTRHWIVQPYMRGSGAQIHRVVTVRG